MNFIPTPQPWKRMNVNKYIEKQFDDFARRIRINHYFNTQPNDLILLGERMKINTSNSFNPWTPPVESHSVAIEHYLKESKEKLTAELKRANSLSQRRFIGKHSKCPNWLHETLTELQENKDIIVTEADKNMGVVVMSSNDYITEGLRQLRDSKTYTLLDHEPPLEDIWKQLSELLQRHNQDVVPTGRGDFKQSRVAAYILQLRGSSELKLGNFYLLMKVHKKTPVGRPIVSSINTITYYASKYIDRKLQKIYKRIPSFIQSSKELILHLETTSFEKTPECIILCADVDSLYPNIPTKEGLIMMHKSISNRNPSLPEEARLTEKEIDFLCDLMQFVLNNNYFNFGNLVFHQINGTAMGTPAAVVFACLFLDCLESQVILDTQIQPIFYKRYIDDIFAIFNNEQDARRFIDRFNNTLPTITCSNVTIEKQEGIFLDLSIFKGDRFFNIKKFDIKVYQKPQNKYLYLPLCSFHPKSVFPGFIVSELNRYRLCCNNDNDFEEVKANFYDRLLARGYTDGTLNSLFQKHQTRDYLVEALQKHFAHQSQRMKRKPVIFKILHLPETKAVKLRDCIRLTDSVTLTQDGNNVFHGKDPIICYSNPPSISTYFSRNRKSLHYISLGKDLSIGSLAPANNTISNDVDS